MTITPQQLPFVRRRYGHAFCSLCGLEIEPVAYCVCGKAPADEPASDGAETGLARRVAEAVMKRANAGGR